MFIERFLHGSPFWIVFILSVDCFFEFFLFEIYIDGCERMNWWRGLDPPCPERHGCPSNPHPLLIIISRPLSLMKSWISCNLLCRNYCTKFPASSSTFLSRKINIADVSHSYNPWIDPNWDIKHQSGKRRTAANTTSKDGEWIRTSKEPPMQVFTTPPTGQ